MAEIRAWKSRLAATSSQARGKPPVWALLAGTGSAVVIHRGPAAGGRTVAVAALEGESAGRVHHRHHPGRRGPPAGEGCATVDLVRLPLKAPHLNDRFSVPKEERFIPLLELGIAPGPARRPGPFKGSGRGQPLEGGHQERTQAVAQLLELGGAE